MAVYSPSSFVGEHLWHVSRMNAPLGHYSNSRASHICMRSSKKVNKVFACLIFQTWNRSKPTGGSNLKQVGNDRNRNRVCVLNWKPTELPYKIRLIWWGALKSESKRSSNRTSCLLSFQQPNNKRTCWSASCLCVMFTPNFDDRRWMLSMLSHAVVHRRETSCSANLCMVRNCLEIARVNAIDHNCCY